ncbi:ATP-binding protein [Nonomuraea salmonea]
MDAISGRGLQIVGAIADAWGVTATDNGKVVWFCVTP